MLVLVLASIGAVASIVGLHSVQVAHAQTCIAPGGTGGTIGNPHSTDAADDSKANPAGNCTGNPDNSDEGPSNGNPHPAGP